MREETERGKGKGKEGRGKLYRQEKDGEGGDVEAYGRECLAREVKDPNVG